MNQDIKFHVNKLEEEKDPREQARLETKWGKKGQRPNDYLVGRDGDSILIPFECDLCVFRKLRFCDPNLNSPTDKLLLGCIRRMQLDTFWSSAETTVKMNKSKVKQMLKFSSSVNLDGVFWHEGPLPGYDYCAINMLLY